MKYILVLLSLCLCTSARAQTLLVDANATPKTTVVGSRPFGFVSDSGLAWFTADTEAEGRELWCTDGTLAGTRLAVDLRPGPVGSGAANPTPFRPGKILFQRSIPGKGEPWRSDGTPGGTWRIDIGQRDILGMTAFAGFGYIMAREPWTSNFELWKSDGSVAGTSLFLAGTRSFIGQTQLFWPADEQLFFLGTGGLWRTDGTQAGTWQVNAKANTSVDPIVRGNETYYSFQYKQGWLYKQALGVTDGTPGSHTQLADMSMLLGATRSKVYFVGPPAGGNGDYLWRTDGTPSGTIQLGEMPSLAGIKVVGSIGDELIFFFDTGRGDTLYTTDSSPTGFTQISTVASDRFGSTRPFHPGAKIDDRLVFAGYEGGWGKEPWITDGTSSGTLRLADTHPSWPGGFDSNPIAVGGRVVFGAGGPTTGPELWITDGTRSGTQLLLDIQPVQPGTDGSAPTPLGRLGDSAYFAAKSPEVTLWKTDGTPSGTSSVLRFPNASWIQVPAFADDWMLLNATDSTTLQIEPWITDGTIPGSRPLFSQPALPFSAIGYGAQLDGGRVVFGAGPNLYDLEPWITDGTEAGTRQITDLVPGSSGSDLWFFRSSGKLWISSDTPSGHSLYTCDGTAQGTRLIGTWPSRGSARIYIGNYDDHLLFNTYENGIASLWSSDGTAAGTMSILSGAKSYGLMAFEDRLLISERMDQNVTWLTTKSLPPATTPLATHSTDTHIHSKLGRHDFLFFDDESLFRQDVRGGPATLVLHKGTWNWPSYSGPEQIYWWDGGSTVLLTPAGLGSPRELWRTDGTPAGSYPLASQLDISNYGAVLRVEDRVILGADDGIHGTEMHALNMSLFDDFAATEYQLGCSPNGAPPSITYRGEPRASSSSPFSIELENAPPMRPGFLAWSTVRGAAPFAGCTIAIGGTLSLIPINTDEGGSASVTFPPSITTAGTQVNFQFGVFEPAGWSTTAGLEVVQGP